MTIAVILAGGSGKRFGANKPKQFLMVAGKMIIQHSIEAFHNNKSIDEIAIVCHKDYVDDIRNVVKTYNYNKVKNVLPGGKERYHSSLAALSIYKNPDDKILFHDAVRPLISQRIISDCVETLKNFDAVEVAVPTTDTIVEVNEDGYIRNIPNRSCLRNVQTPQGFKVGCIAKAFEIAMKDQNFIPTDDCSVVFKYLPDTIIKIIEGESTNIKITYKSDMEMAEKVLNK